MECLGLVTLLLFVALECFLQFGVCLQTDYENTTDTNETARIIGGETARRGMFPWTVALYKNGRFVCTGSIISEKAVLTAAHCVVSTSGKCEVTLFHAIAGDVNKSSRNVERLNFVKFTTHSEFNRPRKYDNDVAILETSKPIHFSRTIQKICIASPKIGKLVNKQAIAMGWGQMHRYPGDQKRPNILQYARLELLSNSKCSFRSTRVPVRRNQMCSRESRSGISFGDSGGPLVFYKRQKPIQVGIASKKFVGRYVKPTVSIFTRVSSHANFIWKASGNSACVV